MSHLKKKRENKNLIDFDFKKNQQTKQKLNLEILILKKSNKQNKNVISRFLRDLTNKTKT